MKKILCTTDFSRQAAKVCRYAVQLAKQTNARLYILHASHPSFIRPFDTEAMDFDESYVQTYYEAKLKRLARRLVKSVDGGISIETINKTGFAVEVITEMAKQIRPDLLLMGTVGQLPRSPGVIGNLGSEMIGKSPVPLMLVPPKAKFRAFENVYMAVDVSEKVDAVTLQKMINSLKTFKVIINIFSVVRDPEASQVKEVIFNIREMLKDYPHIIDIVKGDNFVQAFLNGAQAHKADLMIVFPKQHGWFDRWFKGTNTEELILRTELPMIAIA
ncbi:universal stress protein [Emticicia soli]|uniref:Universal stress protein n=1 Tax=Emticicia soli TaxID=2027878 RepID=A0ABW5J7K4_9BACT